jgi:dCMP deaminase
MKQKWIDAYLDVAERFAQLSSATRLKVGAVIVSDHRILSVGYNGQPAGWDNACEEKVFMDLNTTSLLDISEIEKKWPYTVIIDGSYRRYSLVTKSTTIHAEQNAIAKLARDSGGGHSSEMFCTHAPCVECAKMIYSSGIRKLYYRNEYRSTDGVEFLRSCNIPVIQIPYD